MSKKKENYINNSDLLPAIIKYNETGEISEKLHLMFYQMCNKIICRPRFVRCTKEWKEELIHFAYLKCIKVLTRGKFNVKKYKNPFSYFTSVISNSFLDTIHLENKQKVIREKLKTKYCSIT